MAQHIESVAGSSIPKGSALTFLSQARNGDLVFCSGSADVSHAIEGETKSPFSHVLQLWLPAGFSEWLTLESTIEKGVHVGQFSEYVGGYDGDLVLCRRPSINSQGVNAIQSKFMTILDDNYDWRSEVSQAVRKLLSWLPVIQPKAEYYCSGSQWYASTAWSPALKRPSQLYLPTPEDNFTDSSVEAIFATLKQ